MKRIYRSRTDKIIAGVCGGFADYLNIDPTIVRIIWIIFTIFSGVGLFAYIISIIIISENSEIKSKEVKTETDENGDEKLLIWGVVIIIVGVLLFFRHKPISGLMWHSFSGSWFNILIAIAIIGIGIYIILNRNNEEKNILKNLKINGLSLSDSDKKIAGVCGGISESLQIDSTIVRLIWVIGTLFSAGLGIILYIICILIFNRSDADSTDKIAKK